MNDKPCATGDYALRLYTGNVRRLSHELSASDAAVFLVAAEHLAGYLRNAYALRPLPMDPADVIAEFVRLFEAGEVEYQWKHSNIWCAASTRLLCRYRLKPKPAPLTAPPPTDWPEPVRQAAIAAAKEAGVVFAEVGP